MRSVSRGAIERAGAPVCVRPDTFDVGARNRPSETVESMRGPSARHTFKPHPRFSHPQDIFMTAAQLPQVLEQ
jgi:hypothetical protein